MIEYRCPKCNQVFVTFKVLCHHAESCHAVEYLYKKTDVVKVKPKLNLAHQSEGYSLIFDRLNHSVIDAFILDSNYVPLTKPKEFHESVFPITTTKPSFPYQKNQNYDSSPVLKNYPAEFNVSTRTPSYHVQTKPFCHKNGLDAMQIVFLKYLDSISLWRCRSVCKAWRTCLQQPMFWKTIKLPACYIDKRMIAELSLNCQLLLSISLEEVELKNVSNTKGALESSLEYLLKAAQKVTSVSLINCGNQLTERSLWIVSSTCPYLKQFAYVSAFYPAIPEALWSLGAGCRLLQTLIVPPVYKNEKLEKSSDHSLSIIGKCWPKIKTICIGGTSVTLKGLLSMIQRCQDLEALELDHMGEIEESAIPPLCKAGLQNLQLLYLTRTPIAAEAVLKLKYFCKNLKRIKIVVSPSDYYLHPHIPANKLAYSKKIESLRKLAQHRGMESVLTIVDCLG